MAFPAGETVLWEQFNGTVEDDRGDDTPTWAAAVEVDGVAFSPARSTEPRNGSSKRVLLPATIYGVLPAGVDSQDRFTVRGVVYEVVGMGQSWINPFTGWDAGDLVELERVTG